MQHIKRNNFFKTSSKRNQADKEPAFRKQNSFLCGRTGSEYGAVEK